MTAPSAEQLVAQMLGDEPDDALDGMLDIDEAALCAAFERAALDGAASKAAWWDAVGEFAEYAGRAPRREGRALDLASFAERAGGEFAVLESMASCLGAFEPAARTDWARRLAAHPHDGIALNAISVLADDGAVAAGDLERLRASRKPWRTFALEILLRCNQPGAIEQIVREISADSPMAWSLFDTIESHAPPSDVAQLRRLYEKRFFVSWIAPRAASAAVVLQDRGALEWLRRHADSRKTEVRAVALAELLRVGDEGDRRRVTQLVRSNDEASYWIVVRTRLGSQGPALARDENRDFGIWCVTEHPQPDVRIAALDVFESGVLRDQAPPEALKQALNDADEDVQQTASRLFRIAALRGLTPAR